MGGEDEKPFIKLIEGGEQGQTYGDMQDFFYYSMIRSKDENTTKTRVLDKTVPLNELPNLMRAMGYYPTEQEVSNMMDEVRFSNYSDQGEARESVTMKDFIKLFVNHRPVYGIGKNDIEQSFKDLVGEDGGLQISRDDLINKLLQEGEFMSQDKLQYCFNYLVGERVFSKAVPKNFISAEEFASDLLGFEECEDGEEEEEGANGAANQSFDAAGAEMGSLKKIAEAVPEDEGM